MGKVIKLLTLKQQKLEKPISYNQISEISTFTESLINEACSFFEYKKKINNYIMMIYKK
jgi:hypothetical protein